MAFLNVRYLEAVLLLALACFIGLSECQEESNENYEMKDDVEEPKEQSGEVNMYFKIKRSMKRGSSASSN